MVWIDTQFTVLQPSFFMKCCFEKLGYLISFSEQSCIKFKLLHRLWNIIYSTNICVRDVFYVKIYEYIFLCGLKFFKTTEFVSFQKTFKSKYSKIPSIKLQNSKKYTRFSYIKFMKKIKYLVLKQL